MSNVTAPIFFLVKFPSIDKIIQLPFFANQEIITKQYFEI